jgi:hypothetical protein
VLLSFTAGRLDFGNTVGTDLICPGGPAVTGLPVPHPCLGPPVPSKR